MEMADKIGKLLAAEFYAVVGASTNPEKYGHIAYVTLKAFGKTVYAINPRAPEVDGDPCYATLTDLPEKPEVVVAVVPSRITESLVSELVADGITGLWIQPGAESAKAVADAEAAGIITVHGGPCIMVGLRTMAHRQQLLMGR